MWQYHLAAAAAVAVWGGGGGGAVKRVDEAPFRDGTAAILSRGVGFEENAAAAHRNHAYVPGHVRGSWRRRRSINNQSSTCSQVRKKERMMHGGLTYLLECDGFSDVAVLILGDTRIASKHPATVPLCDVDL
jgi:hypothetical protein